MADGTIGIDETNLDKLLDTEQLTVGANTVHRERIQLAGTGATDLAKVADLALNVTVNAPLVAARTSGEAANVAAGASSDITASTIPAGVTGKLMGVTLASSAAGKYDIKSRDGVVETLVDTVFVKAFGTFQWVPPHRDFASRAGDGVDTSYRVTATNLDQLAADMHATFYWDEI